MDGFTSTLAVVKQFRAMGPLPSVLLAVAGIVLAYSFIQSRKRRVTSSNVAHTSPVTEKDGKTNKNREPGGMF